ncbi:MAG: hypothetical protein LBI54_08705 [Lachnospiraceae bacterium]|jgi:hypothetical protein|nr:hypothetical protein [Lachnospiraceae bacterium]
MNKITRPLLALSYVTLIVLLGLYALGAGDNGGVFQVDNQEYAVGEFWYSGGFQEGLFNDYGEISFQNGDSYKGGFKDGHFDGAGVYRRAGDGTKGAFRFEGTFAAGQPVSGTYYFADGETIDVGSVNEQD